VQRELACPAELRHPPGADWALHPQLWVLTWSEPALVSLGAPPGYRPSLCDALHAVEEEDRPNLFAAVVACLREGRPFCLTVTLRTWDGGSRRVMVEGWSGATPEGSPLAYGTVRANRSSSPARDTTQDRGLTAGTQRSQFWELIARAILHELGSCLAALRGFASALAGTEQQLTPRGIGYLGRISAAGERMHALLAGLVQLADANARVLHPARVDMSRLAQECVEALMQSAPSRRVDIRIQRDMLAYGDITLLRLALNNLLGNAWKFTADTIHPVISLSARVQEDGASLFVVQDNGCGFPASEAGRLFMPFQRLHNPGSYSGSGIGLAIVRLVIERHGGTVLAHSAPGYGATFSFTLPVAP